MYLNFKKIFEKFPMEPVRSIMLLQAIHQQRGEDNEEHIAMIMEDDILDSFVEEGLVETIKGTKKDSEISKLRTTKKGRQFLLDLQRDSDWDDEDETIANWIEGVYKKKPSYVKSNMSELKRRLNWFKFETGIHRNELSVLLTSFIQDSFVDDPNDKRPFNERFRDFKAQNKRAQLSNKAENIIFTPKDMYQKAYNLEQSPLWDYYRNNEKYIESKWKKI